MIMTSDAVNTSDDRAVAEVLDEVYAAWASGDADAFVTPYTEHATAVLPGPYLQGKDTIRSTMAAGFVSHTLRRPAPRLQRRPSGAAHPVPQR
jgi:ketosteroid isomerase-like protein